MTFQFDNFGTPGLPAQPSEPSNGDTTRSPSTTSSLSGLAAAPVFDLGMGDPYQPYEAPPVIAPPGRPPMLWLWASIGAALVGLALALVLRNSVGATAGGWLLAGPAAILLLGRFIVLDQQQRSRPSYLGPAWIQQAPILAGLISLISVAVAAWFFATWIASR